MTFVAANIDGVTLIHIYVLAHITQSCEVEEKDRADSITLDLPSGGALYVILTAQSFGYLPSTASQRFAQLFQMCYGH